MLQAPDNIKSYCEVANAWWFIAFALKWLPVFFKIGMRMEKGMMK